MKEMKEINKKEINEKAEIDKRLSVFYNELNYINNSLDILRNRFFNMIITRMYIKDINFSYQEIINNITKNIGEIDKNYIELVNSLNIHYGDKSNEIMEFIEKNYSSNDYEKLNKETDKKTKQKKENTKKITEEKLLCSELKTTVKTIEQNLTD